jgi:enoyl-CoA hydratase/carnithine racemase
VPAPGGAFRSEQSNWPASENLAAEGTRFFFPELGLGVFVTGNVTELLSRLVGLQ